MGLTHSLKENATELGNRKTSRLFQGSSWSRFPLKVLTVAATRGLWLKNYFSGKTTDTLFKSSASHLAQEVLSDFTPYLNQLKIDFRILTEEAMLKLHRCSPG